MFGVVKEILISFKMFINNIINLILRYTFTGKMYESDNSNLINKLSCMFIENVLNAKQFHDSTSTG